MYFSIWVVSVVLLLNFKRSCFLKLAYDMINKTSILGDVQRRL